MADSPAIHMIKDLGDGLTPCEWHLQGYDWTHFLLCLF
jgi:hypothetical protein